MHLISISNCFLFSIFLNVNNLINGWYLSYQIANTAVDIFVWTIGEQMLEKHSHDPKACFLMP